MSTAVWIALGIIFLILLSISSNKTNKSSDYRSESIRIDRIHYFDRNDHQCSVCGVRFEEERMVCPRCGARFKTTKDDDDEFIEEIDLWEDDEE